MSSVLVIGGTGVIGVWVARKLVEDGHQVTIFDRNPVTVRIADILDKVRVIAGDTTDLANLVRAIKENDAERVINLATTAGQGESDAWLAHTSDCRGALNVLEACRLCGVNRLVYTSSKAVYDTARGRHAHPHCEPIDEDYPTLYQRPHEPCSRAVYAINKLYVENMGLHYNRLYGLDFIAVRLGTSWGPGKLERHGSLSPVEIIVEGARHNKPVEWPQGGDQKDDFIYYKDIARGLGLACFSENLKHRLFNLGTGKAQTLSELADICNGIFGTSIRIGPGPDYIGWLRAKIGDQPILNGFIGIYNIDRVRAEFGFEPLYDFATGVKDYLEITAAWEKNAAR